jgi:hypothetical protein
LLQPIRHDPFEAGACDACHSKPDKPGGGE